LLYKDNTPIGILQLSERIEQGMVGGAHPTFKNLDFSMIAITRGLPVNHGNWCRSIPEGGMRCAFSPHNTAAPAGPSFGANLVFAPSD